MKLLVKRKQRPKKGLKMNKRSEKLVHHVQKSYVIAELAGASRGLTFGQYLREDADGQRTQLKRSVKRTARRNWIAGLVASTSRGLKIVTVKIVSHKCNHFLNLELVKFCLPKTWSKT